MNTQGTQVKGLLINGLAIVGFVAVLLIGLWGTVQVVKLAPAAFSNIASVISFKSVFVPNEAITLNTPNSLVPSGTTYSLNWEHTSKPENGTYAFSYACKEGVSFKVSTNNEQYEEVACDNPYSFQNNTHSLFVTPTSKTVHRVDVPFSLTSFDTSGEATTLDDNFFTIVNESIAESTTTQEGNTTVPQTTAGEKTKQVLPVSSAHTVSNPNGHVDLAVRIIGVGTIDANDIFTKTSSLKVTDSGAVRFSVINTGSKTSDNWTFNVVLPTFPMHIFHSTNQKALAPGDRIDFTLGFDQLNKDLAEGVITINADPTGSVRNEVTKDNNIAQITFTIVK
ncbi:MAG: hypothetical protein WD509_00145 [Candidatus Paceibacterota bacterium]